MRSRINAHNFTAPHLRARGRRPKVEWTVERLEKLQDLCARGASLDDISIAFDGLGTTTLATGMRELVRQLAHAGRTIG